MTDNPARSLFGQLAQPFTGEVLFDHVADTVWFIKDAEARYVAVNTTLVERCGVRGKSELLGRRADELFPAPLGERILHQDRQILGGARVLNAELELHLYPDLRQGWCLTWKRPLQARDGQVAGLCGISRDLSPGQGAAQDLDPVAGVLDHVNANLDQPLRVTDLAARAGLSGYQIDQRVRALFGISLSQYITRARIDAACHLLESGNAAISQVALDCGYADQGAFSRQFRRSVGIPPGAYRERRRRTTAL